MDNLKTNFGKRKVSSKLKTKLVQDVFTNVASNYDLMNDFMSFGSHRLWKKELIDLMNIQKNETIVDVGSGTGDLINLILKLKKNNSIYAVDLNSEMLKLSEKRHKNKNITFLKANAEKLPFNNSSIDKYIISFCLRNVTDIDNALKESYRILKPGGIFYCLEFSSPESSLIKEVYNQYKKNVIPWIGSKVTNNKGAYKYLEESIDQFPNQKQLISFLNKIGFINSNYLNIFNGIVSIHIAYKI